MIEPADAVLLAEVRKELFERPFANRVRVADTLGPRRLARQIERNLSRLQGLERRQTTA